jgi:hypothetical protein
MGKRAEVTAPDAVTEKKIGSYANYRSQPEINQVAV